MLVEENVGLSTFEIWIFMFLIFINHWPTLEFPVALLVQYLWHFAHSRVTCWVPFSFSLFKMFRFCFLVSLDPAYLHCLDGLLKIWCLYRRGLLCWSWENLANSCIFCLKKAYLISFLRVYFCVSSYYMKTFKNKRVINGTRMVDKRNLSNKLERWYIRGLSFWLLLSCLYCKLSSYDIKY